MPAATATVTTTSTIELQPIGDFNTTNKQDSNSIQVTGLSSEQHHDAFSKRSSNDEVDESLSTTNQPVNQLQRWNESPGNIFRFISCCWSLVVLGMNDAVIGALIPSLEIAYSATYTTISLLFLSPLIGYILSALLNEPIHRRFGRRGIAISASCLHLVAYGSITSHPAHFAALIPLTAMAGLGNGLADAAWNAWVANLRQHNELLGILHACYGAGATVAPAIATALTTARGARPWWTFYYILAAGAGLEAVACSLAFWRSSGAVFRAENPRSSAARGVAREALLLRPWARTVWIGTAFLFLYVGVEVALGGWIVTFMLTERHAGAFASGMAAVGFWLGMTVGRVVLGFVTPRIGEKRSLMVYIPIAIGLEILFWLVPQFYVSAVAVALQGFFIGPLFPAIIVVITKILPRHLHEFSIGIAAAAGGCGAAVFPFIVGAIAQSSKKGVQVLQPVVLALFASLFLLWISLPKIEKKND